MFRLPSVVMVLVFATLIFLIWNFSQPVLLAMASAFVLSGIVTRIGGLFHPREQATPAPVEGPPSE
jgi:predicted PurR-regulated permease PerM